MSGECVDWPTELDYVGDDASAGRRQKFSFGRVRGGYSPGGDPRDASLQWSPGAKQFADIVCIF